jgi:hypothetical protein
MKDLFLYLGLGMLLTHELDAVASHEWRILPLVRGLPDDVGMGVFVALHVPVFALLIAGVASTRPRIRSLTRLGVALFLAIHGALHLLFMDHPAYEFSSTLSNTLIFGGAACGILYLGRGLLERSKATR